MDEPQDLKFQFPAGLKKVKCLKHKTPQDTFQEMPRLRRSLIIAYQIQEQLDQGKASSLKEVADWLHLTTARITQIMNLLFLAPTIQEEMILSEDNKINNFTESKIRFINKEINWESQLKLSN